MPNKQAETILVVDDNPAGRYATSRVLRASGFAALEASTGMEGLALAQDADLVILDVNLPDLSGFEVCRRLRSDPRTARLPVIHLSSTFVNDRDKVKGLDAGADGYLTHPVEPPVLIATVNAFLRTRRAEDEMRKSEAKFKAIFDQTLSGILLVSKDLVCLEANPAMCQILGRAREELIGRHLSSFVPANFEPQTVNIAQELEDRGSYGGTFPLIRSDGSHVELEWSIVRHSVPGVRLATVHDVTERKAYEAERDRLLAAERSAREEAEQANRLKDEFLATLSHELRTPLNAIIGWSQILKMSGAKPADVAEGVAAIERNAQSQAQLISDLLDVSRIISGKLHLDVRMLDPAEVVRAAISTVSLALQAKNIGLEESFELNAGPVKGDPDRIQQVIWNLLNNSAKFTPKGGRVRISLRRNESQVEISVADNGQGIKPEFLPYIFERFRQQDASTRRNQGGLGLGLAIVKHLIEMHGGTISAHSEGEKQGTTFTVRLPIQSVHEPVVSDVDQNLPQPGYGRARRTPALSRTISLDGLRILVVEDEPDARTVLRRVLMSAGAEVHEAADVRTAMEELSLFLPDVLISDIGMPQEDGFDLIRAVRSRISPKSLPAIALTAFAREEDRQRSLAAGFQFHLSKPVDADELLAAIEKLSQPMQPAEGS